MKLTGARILMECLREQKVDTIFGYPGGTILNVYDALYDYKEITHILTSHEQGAAHAADGCLLYTSIGFLWQKFTIPLFRDSANFWKCYER